MILGSYEAVQTLGPESRNSMGLPQTSVPIRMMTIWANTPANFIIALEAAIGEKGLAEAWGYK